MKLQFKTIRMDCLRRQVDSERAMSWRCGMLNQTVDRVLTKRDRQQAVGLAIVMKDPGKACADQGPDPQLRQSPDRMFPAGTASEIGSDDEESRLRLWEAVENEVLSLCSALVEPQGMKDTDVQSVRATGEYLRRWGFTPQKPIKRAYEQRPEAVKQWLDHEYPAIERAARAEGGEIHWGDETALVNTDVRRRSYAPRGKTPVTMAVGGTREKLSMISTVTNRGRANWMIIDGAFNHERLIEFLQALAREGRRRRKKVFLILDNLGVHHCQPVKGWLAENQQDIAVFFLRSYSPELNPDERLNADLKQAIGSKVPVRTKAKLRAAANERMQFIASNRDRVRSYFQDPIVKYAT